MTVLEMHLEIRQASQNIAANVRRKLLPQEIDWLLNKIQERFIQSKVKPRKDGSGGFQVDQLDVDSIRTLLVTKEIEALTSGTDYTAQLPADYSYLISDDSKTLLLCGTTKTTTTISETSLVLPLFTTGKSSPNYYLTMSLAVGPNTVISLANLVAFYRANYTGLQSKDEKYVLRDALLWYIRNVLSIEAYWERYKSIIAPYSFIFPGANVGSISIDSGVTTGVTRTISNSKYVANGTWVPNRLTASNEISTMMVTPWVSSNAKSPISELSGDKLIIHGDSSFIVSGLVRIDYIKKPRKINLLLNQDCELPEEFHQSVCDLTVEYFKAMTADPNWEIKMKDNITRNVNINP